MVCVFTKKTFRKRQITKSFEDNFLQIISMAKIFLWKPVNHILCLDNRSMIFLQKNFQHFFLNRKTLKGPFLQKFSRRYSAHKKSFKNFLFLADPSKDFFPKIILMQAFNIKKTFSTLLPTDDLSISYGRLRTPKNTFCTYKFIRSYSLRQGP